MPDFKIERNKETTLKTIEVNENGEFIEFDFGNSEFIKKFMQFENTIKKFKDVTANNFDYDNAMENIYSSIENLFGSGAILKIFGMKTPSVFLIYDFVEQLMPIIESQSKNFFGKNLNRSQRRETARV